MCQTSKLIKKPTAFGKNSLPSEEKGESAAVTVTTASVYNNSLSLQISKKAEFLTLHSMLLLVPILVTIKYIRVLL